jgi:uncharacterized integral membrane protein
VSDIELLWTAIAVVGLGFSAWNIREAWCDLRALKRMGVNSAREILAHNHLTGEIIRGIILAIFAVIGVLAMTLPEVPDQLHQPTRYVIFGAVFRWGLILASALLVTKSILEWLERRQLSVILKAKGG